VRKVEQEIRREATRLILAQERRHRLHAEEQRRLNDRSTAPYRLPPSTVPPWWSIDDGFHPYKSRARSSRISHSIQSALIEREYAPRRPVALDVPKPGGDSRAVSVYQVADSAISKMLYENLLRKNLPSMSSRSYAYRKDLSSQDAIRHIRASLHARPRMYMAEFDFSKYFDAISHEYLWKVLGEHFFVTNVERSSIQAFLTTPSSPIEAYSPSGGTLRAQGIPQGTSISLFLANAAAWDLDRSLEDHGVGFVRYADDTLIWSPDYGRITAAVELLHEHARLMDVAVNLEKSEGLRLLAPPNAKTEMRDNFCRLPGLSHQPWIHRSQASKRGEDQGSHSSACVRDVVAGAPTADPTAGSHSNDG
jgi:RNA-directed DNA polymerase